MLSTLNSLVMKISWIFCVTTGQKTGIEARIVESLFSASPRTNMRGKLNVRSPFKPSRFKTSLEARRKPAIILMLVEYVVSPLRYAHAYIIYHGRWRASTYMMPRPNKAKSPILVLRTVSFRKSRGIGRMKIMMSSAMLMTLEEITALYT